MCVCVRGWRASTRVDKQSKLNDAVVSRREREIACACGMCVCERVCVRKREGKQGRGERQGKTERERRETNVVSICC